MRCLFSALSPSESSMSSIRLSLDLCTLLWVRFSEAVGSLKDGPFSRSSSESESLIVLCYGSPFFDGENVCRVTMQRGSWKGLSVEEFSAREKGRWGKGG